MHVLSKRYEPPQANWRRPKWDAPDMLEVERILPAAEGAVLDRFHELMEHLEQLPKDSETYGLIHQDAHGGNLFVDESGQITLFDFDDCAYSWYMNDIAIVLFYAVMWEEDAAGFTQAFMTHFLRGYSRENHLDPAWLVQIPHFLKLREIDLYAVIHRSFDVESLDDPWCAGYMRRRKERIKNGTPYIEYGFEKLSSIM
jgi:Ser/Thr protein kinase RdoA (MazF antagonist)